MTKNSIIITISVVTVVITILCFTWDKAVGYGVLAAQVEDVIEDVGENKEDIEEGENNLDRLADTVTSFIGETKISNKVQAITNERLAEMVQELKRVK